MKRMFSHDPLTGITEWFVPNEDGGFSIVAEADAQDIVDENKRKQSFGRQYYAADPDMWKIASIPILIQYEWAQKFGITDVTAPEHWPRVRRLLNDPDYRWLKTADIIV